MMLYNLETTLYFSKNSLLESVVGNANRALRQTLLELNNFSRVHVTDFYTKEQLEDDNLKLDLYMIFIEEAQAINFGNWLVSLLPWTPYIEDIEATVKVQEFEDGVLGDIVFEQSYTPSEPGDDPIEADEWVQPTHAGNAFNEQDVVLYRGKLWESLIQGNVWAPGVSGWRQVVDEGGGEVAEWVQPTGAHDAYPLGSIVMHNGKKWQATVDNNVWEPGVFGWQEIE